MATRFRNSFTHREGFEEALIIQGKVVNVNLVNWTVDITSQYDRKRYFEIQVAAPYLHYNNGEGIYAVPEVGASCMVCLPSDSSPPFVLAFIMPFTSVDSSTSDAPQGTQSHGTPQNFAVDASFDGGRVAPKPGDLVLRTRDNNFLILHRGGVLQLGATELAQRIYIPLNNLVTDISENYAHHNASGSVTWGLQDGPSQSNFPSQYMHSFRVFANDEAADIRVFAGDVRTPIGESSSGDQTDLDALKIGDDPKNNPIIYEVAVAKTGFVATTGETTSKDTVKNTVLRFFFDRKGGTFLRCEGSLLISTKKKLKIKVAEDMTVEAKSISLVFKDGADVDGGAYTHIKGNVVRLGAGAQAVARQGDVVTVVFPPGVIPVAGVVGPGPASGSPFSGFIMGGQAIGMITSGNPAVLA